MRVVAAMLLVGVLGGCGAPEAPVDNGANVVTLERGPMLGEVDLSRPVRASGASPFWAMEIVPGRITFTALAGGKSGVSDFYPVDPEVTDDRAIYRTKTVEGEAVTITLTRAKCLEGGKPEISEPLSAEAQIGARRYTGCARPRPEGEVDVAAPMGNAAQ